MTWGVIGGRRGGGRREGGVEGGLGLAGTIKNTARTIPLFTLLFPSCRSYRFPHPLFFSFFI